MNIECNALKLNEHLISTRIEGNGIHEILLFVVDARRNWLEKNKLEKKPTFEVFIFV